MMLLKRLPAAVLFGILLFCSARAETARVDVVGIVTDGNALVFTVQVSAVSDEQDLYGSLDTVYVNGREAETVKSTAPTYGFLTDPQIYTVTLDISAIPPALDYNVAATYTVLRPNQPIRLIDDIITDDFDTYRETVSNLNDQGYVVATRSGDILLAQGTYETDWLISGRLEESGKMTVIDTIPILFTATVGDIAVIEAHGITDMDGWNLAIRKAQVSPLAAALIADEIFPLEYSYEQAMEASRRLIVLDDKGDAFCTGYYTDLSDPERLPSGEWRITFYWSTQSVTHLPARLRLTPYTYDAAMSRIEESDRTIVLELH